MSECGIADNGLDSCSPETARGETTHTPGPWTVVDGHYIESSSHVIAMSLHEEAENDAVLAECEANARLIAAAPDMLKALKYVVRDQRDRDSGEGELYGQDFVTTCIAAIDKAEGSKQ